MNHTPTLKQTLQSFVKEPAEMDRLSMRLKQNTKKTPNQNLELIFSVITISE